MKRYFSKKARKYARKCMRDGICKYYVPFFLVADLDEPCPDSYADLPKKARLELDLLEADIYIEQFEKVTKKEKKAVYRCVLSGDDYLDGWPMDLLSSMRFGTERPRNDPFGDGGNKMPMYDIGSDELPY